MCRDLAFESGAKISTIFPSINTSVDSQLVISLGRGVVAISIVFEETDFSELILFLRRFGLSAAYHQDSDIKIWTARKDFQRKFCN